MKLMISIVPKKLNDKASAIIGKRKVDFQTTVTGSGTASSEILEFLSLESTDKNIIFSLIEDKDVQPILDALDAKLDFSRSGIGGVMTISITSMSKSGYSFIQAMTTKD